MNTQIRTRIAPSPTGDPHIGTLYSAIFNYAFAKQNNGKFILRIEDTDQKRLKKGSIDSIIQVLKWAELTTDEDPIKGGEYSPYIQSERLDIYKEYSKILIENEKAYYCFCTKERLENLRNEAHEKHIQPKYDKHCLTLSKNIIEKNLEESKDFVIRLNVPYNENIVFNDLIRGEITINTNTFDDQILLKTDRYPTYHMAAVIDDHLMKITHVIRGEEWLSSTPKHILLYKAFDWEIPQFAHFSLLRDKDKSKLSKRKNNTSINWFKKEGYLPQALINFLILLGWSHPEGKEIFKINEFIKLFSWNRVTKGGPIFDIDKLNWMNGLYIRQKSNKELAYLLKDSLKKINTEKQLKIIELEKDRLKKLSDFEDMIEYFIKEPYIDDKILYEKYNKDQVSQILTKTLEILDKYKITKDAEIKLKEFAENNNLKIGDFFMVIRVAISGRKATPPLIETMEIIGYREIKSRINNIIGR